MKKLHHINKEDPLWREKWLTKRKEGIGGSDIGAVIGLNLYKSPLMVYLDKTNQLPEEDEENIPAELGLELESFMSKKFAKWIKKTEGLDIEVKEMPYILQHDKIDYFITTLDGYFEHPEKGKCVLEIKTTSEFRREEWKDDKIPDSYYLQVQFQLAITGWEYCYLAFLIGNRKFDVKVIERNEKIIKSLKEKGIEFWTDYIEKNEPPAPIGIISDNIALEILFPEEEKGKILELDIEKEKEIEEFIKKYDELKDKIKPLEKEFNTIKQNLKFSMGDSELAIINNRKITFKTISLPERTLKACSFRKLYISKRKNEKR